ncbi:MAG: hypothetical protein V1652_01145 [bacterium]
MITYEDFSKISLKAGKIIEAETVDKSDKLIRLLVDIGEIEVDGDEGQVRPKVRQILAGIRRRYSPEELIGTYIVVVENLQPRELLGMESNGMLLAADGPDGPVLICPIGEVASGASIR